MKRKKGGFVIIICFTLIVVVLGYMSSNSKNSHIYSSAILIDVNTGEELYSYNPKEIIAPASLTKLVTAYVVFEALERGDIELNKRRPVPEAAWAKNQPSGSSLMNLGPDQRVSIDELLRGLIVVSGNDAAVALAIRVSGSVTKFVDLMNETVTGLGFKKMKFVDPAGISPQNTIEPREFSRFLVHYIKRWSEALARYHSTPKMFYPRAENLPPAAQSCGVMRYNTNHLITSYSGCDGLKTGHISSAGYHLAVTAKRGDKRLLALVLGVRAANSLEGIKLRESEAAGLLNSVFK